MCTRFEIMPGTIIEAVSDLERLGLKVQWRVEPAQEKYGEIFPTDEVLAIARDDITGEIFVDRMKWDFQTAYYNKAAQAETLEPRFNARSETLYEKQAFSESARQRPCIIPGGFYYEWYYKNKIIKNGKMRKVGKGAKMKIGIENATFMCLAGVWQEETRTINNQRTKIKVFSVITTVPNDEIAYIHDRMPAMLESKEAILWLERKNINELLKNSHYMAEATAAAPEPPDGEPEQLSFF